MKIKSDYLLRKVADSYVVVPVGKATVDFNGMINLNETGAFLWQQLQKGADEDALLKAMLKEYEVDEETAAEGLGGFLNKLREADLLE